MIREPTVGIVAGYLHDRLRRDEPTADPALRFARLLIALNLDRLENEETPPDLESVDVSNPMVAVRQDIHL